jgi:hypothetical protein
VGWGCTTGYRHPPIEGILVLKRQARTTLRKLP